MAQSMQMAEFAQFIMNDATTLRRDAINRLLYPTRDIDSECKYPTEITIANYRDLYDRLGLATRVVDLWPDECWQQDPNVYESEDSTETAFEKAFDQGQDEQHWFHYLYRLDRLSGIGRYGCLLFGLSDASDNNGLMQPAPGVNPETGEPTSPGTGVQLLFLRAFDESLLTIDDLEKNTASPRYGMPTIYSVIFEDPTGQTVDRNRVKIHWTRILHAADNREHSEVFGVPRMKNVFNHLLDVKKIGGGSAEMFWKGGFPGYNFKIDPEIADVDLEDEETKEKFKEQIRLYSEGLQRYMALVGVSVENLQPQVADPKGHLEGIIKLIAMAKSVPWRLLQGTEEARLASSQDKSTWNGRVARRQRNYLTPMIVRPFVDRLMAYGVLPPVDEYTVDWPDLNAPSDLDLAEIAAKRTEAYAKYVQGKVWQVIPPREYHMTIQGLEEEVAEALEAAADDYTDEGVYLAEEPEPEPQPTNGPPNDQGRGREGQE